jgi:hypothetical protein
MRNVTFVLGAALSLGLAGVLANGAAYAGESEYRVVVDPESSITSATRELVAEAFLKTTTRWPDGETIRPVDQRSDTAVRKAFSEGILKRTVSAVRLLAAAHLFRSRRAPSRARLR